MHAASPGALKLTDDDDRRDKMADDDVSAEDTGIFYTNCVL